MQKLSDQSDNYFIDEPGIYSKYLSSTFGCDSIIQLKVILDSGTAKCDVHLDIYSMLLNNEAIVYPNPFTQYLYVRLLKDIVGGKLTIIDFNGRTVLIKDIVEDSVRLDLSALQKGLYILKISSLDSVYHYKIIKE